MLLCRAVLGGAADAHDGVGVKDTVARIIKRFDGFLNKDGGS